MSDHPQSPPPRKASYEAPTLKRLGSITELTHGGFSPNDDFTLAGSLGD